MLSAKSFREYWLLAGDSETGGYQKYWLDLLGVLGADDATRRIEFQLPVATGRTTLYLDAWIPETKVLVEHKARGMKLDAPQAGHGGKTPYEQALEYNIARPFSEKARWIVTCNFDEIWVYDMDRPLAPPEKIRLDDLPREIARLAFLADRKTDKVRSKEKEISIKAGRIVGEMYAALLKRYGDNPPPESLAALNRLCVRLVFVFYAEDAGLFPKDAFWALIKATPAQFLRQRLKELFKVLDTPSGKRDRFLEPELSVFPYTNGGLFSGADADDIPPLDEDMRTLLVESSNFDWRDISPVIFGALFESTLNPVTRRAGGMVYTSVENIHKVIDPLFLDDLTRRVDSLCNPANPVRSKSKLLALQSEIASLAFLDPACGSGNFLTETFLSLRRLENRIVAALQQGQTEFNLGDVIKVSISQFHGIEINDFAVAVAKTAMWIAEAQMTKETAEILHRDPDFLPLREYTGIVEGNALRLDWPQADYIMGNPPFIGARNKSKEQAADMEAVFGSGWKNLGALDYVTCWYKKAMESAAGRDGPVAPRCAFVSTNSICQGDCVAALWKPLFEKGLEIDFVWRTFKWDSESAEKAHVHCVIVGFSLATKNTKITKKIYDGDSVVEASHINGYLMDAPDAFIESRSKPICEVPPLVFGSMPNDGGFLSDWSDEDKAAVIKKHPEAQALFRPLLGSQEFINGKSRWCLWLKGAAPASIRAVPPVMQAVEKVREMRLASKRESTRKLAATPTLFGEIRQPEDGNYLLVPSVSSEKRSYVPMGFMAANVIASNLVLLVPSATLYHFGVLTSSVHMAWMRAVAGRLKSDYRYSANIVYNNFPWPKEMCNTITQTAQAILDARALYPTSSLADLYDPLTMPPELRRAHAANDAAVLAAYGLAPDTPEPAIVAHLFNLYAKAVKTK